jgi:biopolymer transport protein TolQ
VTHDLSFWSLIANASLIVQLIMLGLVLISLSSWWVIVKKASGAEFREAGDRSVRGRFLVGDRSGFAVCADQPPERTGRRVWRRFSWRAFRNFCALRSQPTMDPESVVSGAQRAMRATGSRELDELEMYLSLLATTGSTSPYIGLLGTVWGIMNAFRALGLVQQATLAQVAPGIAEALIATAMGLFAAIPAVIFYNRYAHEVDRLANRYETFMEEFSNILQRQSYNLRKSYVEAARAPTAQG